MSHRERSAQETAYLVKGLRLRDSTHSTIFVNTKYRLHRTRMLRKESVLKNDLEYNDDDFCSDIHDKYSRRPIELEKLCLAEFAQHWKVKPNVKLDDLQDKDDNQTTSDSDTPNIHIDRNEYTLMGTRTVIKKRKNFACLQTSYISHIEQEEEYYYSLLLLYIPFREEN